MTSLAVPARGGDPWALQVRRARLPALALASGDGFDDRHLRLLFQAEAARQRRRKGGA